MKIYPEVLVASILATCRQTLSGWLAAPRFAAARRCPCLGQVLLASTALRAPRQGSFCHRYSEVHLWHSKRQSGARVVECVSLGSLFPQLF